MTAYNNYKFIWKGAFRKLNKKSLTYISIDLNLVMILNCFESRNIIIWEKIVSFEANSLMNFYQIRTN